MSGGMYGSGVAGACRPLLTSRGPRASLNKAYQTLPLRHHYIDQHALPLKPATTDQRRRPITAHSAGVDCGATGNSYGGRSSSDVDGGSCGRPRRLFCAVSDVDLTSYVERCEYTTWEHPPSITDLSSVDNGLDGLELDTPLFGGALHGGLSLQALPDTHL